MFTSFEEWILDTFDGASWWVQIYGSQILFAVSGVLLVAAVVWREVTVPQEGTFGRDIVARVLTVAMVVAMFGAGLLTAYRLFSNAI
jgi:glucose dehydrogenase